MREAFIRLWALQQVDQELRTLSGKLAALPGRIADLKRAADELHAELDQAREAILDHKKQYRLAEVDLKATEEKIAGYSVQLYSAKTNEQYKAFLKEIEAQKKAKSAVEDTMIVLMEESDALDRKVRENERVAGELDSETARKVGLLEGEKAELEGAILERDDARRKIVAEVPPDLLKRYERIRTGKAGIAVAAIRRERCSACLSPIPPQRIIEVERQDHLYSCEACGRILIVTSE
jgi:predicted  nucleic acid-binding Zn-ribbon protein